MDSEKSQASPPPTTDPERVVASEGRGLRGPWFALVTGKDLGAFPEAPRYDGVAVREALLPAGASILEGMAWTEGPPPFQGLAAAIVAPPLSESVVGAAVGVLCLADGSRRAAVVTCLGGADEALMRVEEILFREVDEKDDLAVETLYLAGEEAEARGEGAATVGAACFFGGLGIEGAS